MYIAIFCARTPTDEESTRIYDLILRTMRRRSLPFYSHMLMLSGPGAKAAVYQLSHAGCNVTLNKEKKKAQHAIVVGGKAPKEFSSGRRQVLRCPED